MIGPIPGIFSSFRLASFSRCHRLDFPFQLAHLSIHFLQVLSQPLQEHTELAGQAILAVFQNPRQPLSDMTNSLRDHDAILAEQPTNLVGLRRAGLNEALARPVQRQHTLLRSRLDRHEAHVGPGHRFADPLGVSHIVLVRLDVGFDELRGHQLYRVAQRLQLPGPIVRAAARFHADQARWQIGEKRSHLLTLELLPQHRFAPLIHGR